MNPHAEKLMQMIDRSGHNDCRTLTDAANEIEQLAAECERLKHERNKATMEERQKWLGKGLLASEQVRPLVEALESCAKLFDEMDGVTWYEDSDFGPAIYESHQELTIQALAKAKELKLC